MKAISRLVPVLAQAGVALALWGAPAAAHAQILSCDGYRELSSEQRQYYTLGFVEGISFTQLDLHARADAASKNIDKTKKADQDKLLVLQVMEGVAGNIELAVPHNLTVGQVTDKLMEICAQDQLKQGPFVDAYYQYFQALLAAETVRRAQEAQRAQQNAAAEKAKDGAGDKPAAGDKPKAAAKPKAADAAKPAAPPATPAPAKPSEAPKPAEPPKTPEQPKKP